ncbi:hypothetical protein M0R45_032246 [Rubus argutus]|uniref:Maturase n=1 Tax=Rubus argutus TaxID=59490 RepID=A0AAW1WJL5_RUBAR
MRHEIIEMNQLVHALPNEGNKAPLSEPRKSAAIACGATVFEVTMKVPVWASQVLRHLAPDVSYHSLVALGIASIQGLPVPSCEKDDAERLLLFCSSSHDGPRLPTVAASKIVTGEKGIGISGNGAPLLPARQRLKAAAVRPIPHVRRPKMTPFSGISEVNGPTHLLSRYFYFFLIRRLVQEEFLKDVMQFLILRGHSQLILNGKRLDLYNLCKEVVTRGRFHVGNGINWNGQIEDERQGKDKVRKQKDRSFPYVKVRDDNRVSGKAGLHFPALVPASMLLFLMRQSSISQSFSELFLPFSQFSELIVTKHKLF